MEKPRPGNPNALTIKQHILPTVSLARFTNDSSYLALQDIKRYIRRPALPSDPIFCTMRAWHQAAESGFMKQIEDGFQPLVERILDGTVSEVRDPTTTHIVNKFYALWYMRARFRKLDIDDIALNGVLPGENLTKEQEENLEKNGYVYPRGNKIPAYQMNGVLLQIRISAFMRQVLATTRWGIIQAQAGEFIVPDVPTCIAIPLTPTVCLMSGTQDIPIGIIGEQNVAKVNRVVRSNCQEYFFARDLAACPF